MNETAVSVFIPFVVPPRWIREPQDTALMLGNAISINCEAEGYPEPEITWLKGGNFNMHLTNILNIPCSMLLFFVFY